MRRKRCGIGKVGLSHHAQCLLTKGGIPLHTQLLAQLCVIAQFGVCIQRQVIGKQTDVMGKQQADALLHPAGDASIHAAPKQAVVHEDGISLVGNGRLNQGAAGSYTADDVADLGFAFYLQAIGAVVFEALGLEQSIEMGEEVLSLNHGNHCAKPTMASTCTGIKKGSRSCPWDMAGTTLSGPSPSAASHAMP